MRVLLIKPSFKGVYGKFKNVATEYPPLGLAYIAALLEKNGHEVRIVDMPAENVDENKLIKILTDFSPMMVGITSVTPTIDYSYRLAEIIKDVLPTSLIVIGGIHATTVPNEVLSNSNVDFVVRGEGEHTMVELAGHIEEKNANYNKIFGLSFKNNGEIINNQNRPLLHDLDSLPFPARHLLPMKKYHYVDVKANPMTTIMTSRGCPFNCIYCDARHVFGRGFRARSAKNVVDEIEHIINEYGIKEFHFLDDLFTLNRKRVFEVCDEIKKRKLDFVWTCPNGVRVDSIDKEMLEAMKSVGCYGLAFGVESGDQKILNNIRKGTTIGKIREAFKLCKEVGLETWGFFMFGLPEETEKTIQKTINFAIELDPDVAKFHITVPFPGTDLFKEWSSHGYIKITDWTKYGIHVNPVFEIPTISSEKIIAYHREAYRRFYLRPKYLMKFLKRMNSPTRVKNNVMGGLSIVKYVLFG